MTEEERSQLIIDRVWYWLPVRWYANGFQWEITNLTITGDVDSGGISLSINKDGTPVDDVSFTNDELYGDTPLSSEQAHARVEV